MSGWWHRIRWPIAALLGCCLAGAFGVVAVIQRVELQEGHVHVDWDHVHVEWGNAAEWAAGTGTVLAFGATLFVFYRQMRERWLADRRQQAELITGWTGASTPTYREFVQGKGREYVTTMRVNLINASPSVIYDLVVVLTCTQTKFPVPVTVDPGTAASSLMQAPDMGWEPREIGSPVARLMYSRPADGR